LLNITTELRSFLGFETTNLEVPNLTSGTGEIFSYNVTLPQTEISRVQTRVSVPDSGTLLLGGQKITAETDTEAGVPILSKIPILGRAFRNNSTIRDSKILLILVKPTIILQDEADSEALAELNGEF
jgi:type II secretory pathway component GspD/PulD (secretin)